MKRTWTGAIAAMLVTCVVLVPFARATPYVLWETFSDTDGNPAFHPLFVHSFEPHPERGTEHLSWDIGGYDSGNWWLYVGSTTINYITFLLEPGQYVSHASVSHPEGQGDITFIGQNGSKTSSIRGWCLPSGSRPKWTWAQLGRSKPSFLPMGSMMTS
ncbi:MAG: hypothetical protein ACNA71_03600 [Kiritimatiellia bacterium]